MRLLRRKLRQENGGLFSASVDGKYGMRKAEPNARPRGSAFMKAETSQIHRILQGLQAGWLAGSGAQFAVAFAPQARFVAFDGTTLTGPSEMANAIPTGWSRGTGDRQVRRGRRSRGNRKERQ